MQTVIVIQGDDAMPPDGSLATLGAIRQHAARKKCVLLIWQALEEALEEKFR